MKENEITSAVVACAIDVHRELGPGLLESVYQEAMVCELRNRELSFVSEVVVPVVYKGMRIDRGFRADIIVEDKVILELKSVEEVSKVHKKQLLTYLRLSRLRVGLLLNFGAVLMRDGITRIVNGYEE